MNAHHDLGAWRGDPQDLIPDIDPRTIVDNIINAINQRRPDWHQHAACRGHNTASFFPERGATNRDARQVCAKCPVVEQCLQHALDQPERFGTWGGTGESQRRQLRRHRAQGVRGSKP